MKIVCSIFFCAVLLLAGGCFSVAPAKSPELPAEKSKIIILDPGHGGHDPGAAGVFSQEKNLNLALALAVEKELQQRGFQVYMSRRDDTFISLAGRCRAAEKTDIFVSLHHNASLNKKASGVETYAPSTRRENHTRSVMLAFSVHRRLAAVAAIPDRGMRSARYYVLENTKIPAILVEAGFISNAGEEKLINTVEYRQRIAAAIADGIVDFFTSEALKQK